VQDYNECVLPWDNANVLANGDIKPCCWCRGNIGNLNDASFEDIWNGEKIVELRKNILEGEIHPMCLNAPCPYKTTEES
jgi:radical SAM protein with 4Fe4S-binding SPASM domain